MPVVVIAQEETETSSAALGKKLNLKELRLANAELLKEFFGVDKDSCACAVPYTRHAGSVEVRRVRRRP